MTGIKVNKDQWSSLSSEDQDRIRQMLKDILLKDDVNVIADPGHYAFDKNRTMVMTYKLEEVERDPCRVACDSSAGDAVRWCKDNMKGGRLGACLAAVDSAHHACKNICREAA